MAYEEHYLPMLRGVSGVDGRRKLINAGWHRPGPRFLHKHGPAMQRAPFDGVVFNLWEPTAKYRPGNTLQLFHHQDMPGFALDDVDPADFDGIPWTTFTDNLVAVAPCRTGTTIIDFHSEAEWIAASSRIELLNEVIRRSGAAGIWLNVDLGGAGFRFDAEFHKGMSFAEVAHQARLRGSQFMEALQDSKADITVLFTFMAGSRYEADLGEDRASTRFALLPYFAAGMLDAKLPEATIIDGSDSDYSAHDSRQFTLGRQQLVRTWAELAHESAMASPDSLQIGAAVYLDAVSLISESNSFLDTHFSFYEQVRGDQEFGQHWAKHNVYHAMLKSDRYVWLWNERMSWWSPGARPVPAGLDSAIREARLLFESGAALGYDMCRMPGGDPPAFVRSPSIRLDVVRRDRNGTNGELVVFEIVPLDELLINEFEQFTLYHNGEVVTESQSPYARIPVRLLAGAHTFHVAGFNLHRTHYTSNPLVLVSK